MKKYDSYNPSLPINTKSRIPGNLLRTITFIFIFFFSFRFIRRPICILCVDIFLYVFYFPLFPYS